MLTAGDTLSSHGGRAVQGLIPSDDFRFVRLAWEVPTDSLGRGRQWPYYAKGGEYSPFWGDIHLVVNWANNGHEIRNFYGDNGRLRSRPQGIRFYYRAGVTYPERTTSDFSPRVLPKDSVFSSTGQAIFTNDADTDVAYICGAYSRPFKLLIDAIHGSGDCSVSGSAATHYRAGVLEGLPIPLIESSRTLRSDLLNMIRLSLSLFESDETTRYFGTLLHEERTLAKAAISETRFRMSTFTTLLDAHYAIDNTICCELGFRSRQKKVLDALVGPHPLDYSTELSEDDKRRIRLLWNKSESELVAEAVATCGARRPAYKKSILCGSSVRTNITHHSEEREGNCKIHCR